MLTKVIYKWTFELHFPPHCCTHEATTLVMFSTFSYYFMAIQEDYQNDYSCLVLHFICSSWDYSWRGSTLRKEEGLGEVANLLFVTLFLTASLWVCPSTLSFMFKIWISREPLARQTLLFPKVLFHSGGINIAESCQEDWLVAIVTTEADLGKGTLPGERNMKRKARTPGKREKWSYQQPRDKISV